MSVVTVPYELDEEELEHRQTLQDINGMHDNEHMSEQEYINIVSKRHKEPIEYKEYDKQIYKRLVLYYLPRYKIYKKLS